MKHFFSGMLIALILALALIAGVVATAENAAPDQPELPAAEELAPEQPTDGAEAQQPDAAASDTAASDTALQEALEAYRAAKDSARQEALEDELNGYVESGKLTREQADLILKQYTDRQALRNGTCPGCGYQFDNGAAGKGGRMQGNRGMNGGKGGRGGRMNGGFGQQGMQAPGQNQMLPQTPGNVAGFEGI